MNLTPSRRRVSLCRSLILTFYTSEVKLPTQCCHIVLSFVIHHFVFDTILCNYILLNTFILITNRFDLFLRPLNPKPEVPSVSFSYPAAPYWYPCSHIHTGIYSYTSGVHIHVCICTLRVDKHIYTVCICWYRFLCKQINWNVENRYSCDTNNPLTLSLGEFTKYF